MAPELLISDFLHLNFTEITSKYWQSSAHKPNSNIHPRPSSLIFSEKICVNLGVLFSITFFCLSQTSLACPRSYPSPCYLKPWSHYVSNTDISSAFLEAVRAEHMLPFHCTSGRVDLTSHFSHPDGCKPQTGKTFHSGSRRCDRVCPASQC